jgi:hypothetical protein
MSRNVKFGNLNANQSELKDLDLGVVGGETTYWKEPIEFFFENNDLAYAMMFCMSQDDFDLIPDNCRYIDSFGTYFVCVPCGLPWADGKKRWGKVKIREMRPEDGPFPYLYDARYDENSDAYDPELVDKQNEFFGCVEERVAQLTRRHEVLENALNGTPVGQ